GPLGGSGPRIVDINRGLFPIARTPQVGWLSPDAIANAVSTAIRFVPQGATLGFADEIGGTIQGTLDALGLGPEGSKGTFSRGYKRFREIAGRLDQEAAARNPYIAAASEIAGGLLPGMIMGPLKLFRVPAVAKKGASFLTRAGNEIARASAKAGNTSVTGATLGGIHGFATGGGDWENRLGNVPWNALLGGMIGAAVPLVGAAARRLGGVLGPAARRIGDFL